MKFRKGDRVGALLVCNRWGVDFICYVGTLEKIEKVGNQNPVAQLSADMFIDLVTKRRHKPAVTRVDVRLFKLLPWTLEIQEKVRQLRDASRTLHELTIKLRQLQ